MLADFGFTRVTTISVMATSEGQGTIHFMAPEHILPDKFGVDKAIPSKEADIYALSMTVYQVLTDRLPFFPKKETEVPFAVISGQRPPKPENVSEIGMTAVVWDLLQECWREDKTTRPDISTILGVFCNITGERKTIDSTIGMAIPQLDVAGEQNSVDSQSFSSATRSCEWVTCAPLK